MASTMTVKVHPVVYFTIVDAFERRSNKEGANDKALGTLLGYYEKNGVQVTNCYAVPFSEHKDDAPELDDSYNQSMLAAIKRTSPIEGPVGWFYTNADLSVHCLSYHDYFNRLVSDAYAKKETPPVVLLTLDTTFSSQDGRMGVKAYLRTKAGIPKNKEPHCAIFNPIKVEMDAFAAEMVALELDQKSAKSDKREVRLERGLKRITDTTQEMIDMIDRLRKYVDDVIAGKIEMNPTLGRSLMDLVTSVSSGLQGKKFENIMKNSMRDYMMVSYLAQLTKTQLELFEQMIAV